MSPLAIATLPNLRDIGGYPAGEGRRVRTGRLYRSAAPSKLAGADLDAFVGLGVRTVFDLRTAPEREAEPDIVPPGTEQIVCDVLGDSESSAPASLLRVLEDPAAAERMLGGGKATVMFERAYREFITLPSALVAYRSLFEELDAAERHPALFHCTIGKDRTGWAAAAILLFLGVDEEDVRRDYEQTNRDLLPALKPIFDDFEEAGGDRELLLPVFGVSPAYLDASMAEMKERYGSVEGYFESGLGIGPEAQGALRAALTEPVPPRVSPEADDDEALAPG